MIQSPGITNIPSMQLFSMDLRSTFSTKTLIQFR
jgi:hypothetical protein